MKARNGDLQAAVLDVLWAAEEDLTVREVQQRLHTSRELAYNTVLTVLDTLFKKNLVKRRLLGRAFVYRPSDSREAHTAEVMAHTLDNGGDRSAALLHFVGKITEADLTALRQLIDSDDDKGTRS
ncbi:BlaI/MecI/CopY family transcriptional regulator [Allosaccharopolyspora coralli]|uniref:BlaI/MecI/CopY family transcriptional regulator n=1 Tax=Allosaccharopolyspora coralli TaxID=2665642 RepID=A0A5Q3QFF7_9PSEU|nr:BlaI/MecI/CopY family transcriptional regulator [Allosaccharopolyspora coralli]QGK70265.1 BlaI/MecI/CopY family transcriptional regulator [Allosaccharopolyspora coralli]